VTTITRNCAILCLVLAGGASTLPFLLAEETPAAASQSQPSLPRIKSQRKRSYYPDKAKRLMAEGRTLLAFNIDKRGRPAQVAIEDTDGSKLLTDYAVEILNSMVFDLSAAPASLELENQRYRLSFVFELTPCGRLQHFEVPMDARMSMCGSSIP
jgi:outer membrane biosynthesis protein TonB